jgi:hypothetical protein
MTGTGNYVVDQPEGTKNIIRLVSGIAIVVSKLKRVKPCMFLVNENICLFHQKTPVQRIFTLSL